MTYHVVLTESQELGLAVKLQEENTRRLRPVVVNGVVSKLPQINADQFVQAIIEDISSQGVNQMKQLEEAALFEKVKAASADPVKFAAIEAALK